MPGRMVQRLGATGKGNTLARLQAPWVWPAVQQRPARGCVLSHTERAAVPPIMISDALKSSLNTPQSCLASNFASRNSHQGSRRMKGDPA